MKTILYVDDDKDIGDAVKSILEHYGYQLTLVHTGKECLEHAKKCYDLILIDIMLPDMSGWEILEILKKRCINSKFAMISAIPSTDERVSNMDKSSISAYIPKPFTKIELLSIISNILDNKTMC